MHLRKTVAGIVLAGGTGSRFGGAMNKVYLQLRGLPVINYSINAMDQHMEIDEIVIVVKDGEQSLLDPGQLHKPFRIVTGGASRRQSVWNGINATGADYIVIQDGARPFLKAYYISDCLKALEEYPAAAVGVRSRDTVKLAYENQLVMRTTNRMNTWLVHTPQCFHRDELIKAHLSYQGPDPTDDCMIMEYAKKNVKLISGDYTNIKITMRSDMKYAEHIVDEKEHI